MVPDNEKANVWRFIYGVVTVATAPGLALHAHEVPYVFRVVVRETLWLRCIEAINEDARAFAQVGFDVQMPTDGVLATRSFVVCGVAFECEES